MKKLSLMMFLSLFVVSLSAQKSAVKQAKSAMSSNVVEARELIKPALTNAETSQDPETWKIAGDIEYKAFDKERDLEITKQMVGSTGGNLDVMYEAIYNMVDPYKKADELAQLPDEKGKIKNKVRKDITKNLKTAYPFYLNAGIYYDGKANDAAKAEDKENATQNFKKSADFFEMYWELPSVDFMKDQIEVVDSTLQMIKYYAVIAAIKSGDKQRSVALLNKLLSDPYVANSLYQESDPYELLCVEYFELKDTDNYVKALKAGADKFPKSQYFTPNLINEYMKAGQASTALDYIDLAVKNDPTASCNLLGLKGSLLVNEGKFDEGQTVYEQLLVVDPNCLKGLEGLGVLYGKRAEASKEQVSQTANKQELAQIDKNTIEYYTKSLPYLEKFCTLLEAETGVDKYDVERAYKNLENIYYNLILLNVDKQAEMDKVQKKLEEFK